MSVANTVLWLTVSRLAVLLLLSAYASDLVAVPPLYGVVLLCDDLSPPSRAPRPPVQPQELYREPAALADGVANP